MLQIDELIKEARIKRDYNSLRAYQNLKVEFVNFAKIKGNVLEEASQNTILTKYCKKLEDAIKQYLEADRQDLASEYREELEVLKKLLPEPVDASEIYSELLYWSEKNHFINDEIAYEIEIPKKEMGNAIKYLKSKFPIVDGKVISEIVKENII